MKASKKWMKWSTVILPIALLLSTTVVASAAGDFQAYSKDSLETCFNLDSIKKQIPTTFIPGTILTFGIDLEPIITYDTSAADHGNDPQDSQSLHQVEEVPDIAGRAAEDEFFKSVAESVKHLPVIDLGWDLPEPAPGIAVMYGTDGHIVRVYADESIASK